MHIKLRVHTCAPARSASTRFTGVICSHEGKILVYLW